MGRCKSSQRAPPRLQLQTQSVSVSKQAQVYCGWLVFYLAASIRIHLHADIWIFRPFKVNSLQYVNRLFSLEEQPAGVRERGKKKLFCQRQDDHLCTFMPGVAACPGHPCSMPSFLLALPAPHIDLGSMPLSCPREGLEASYAMTEVVFGCHAAHRHT